MSELVFGLVATLLLGAAVVFAGLSCGNRDEDSDKVAEESDEEYDVCDQHGHDLREPKGDGIESDFKHIVPRWDINYGIISDAVPGSLIGVQYLVEKEVAVCRDCDYEKENSDVVDKRVVFAKDGELKTIDWSHYESLAKEYKAQQE